MDAAAAAVASCQIIRNLSDRDLDSVPVRCCCICSCCQRCLRNVCLLYVCVSVPLG